MTTTTATLTSRQAVTVETASGRKEDHIIVASWQGGPYIDLHWDYVSADTFEVINVWDYRTNEAEIPFTQPALARALTGFIHDPESDIQNYFDHTHRSGKWGPR